MTDPAASKGAPGGLTPPGRFAPAGLGLLILRSVYRDSLVLPGTWFLLPGYSPLFGTILRPRISVAPRAVSRSHAGFLASPPPPDLASPAQPPAGHPWPLTALAGTCPDFT